MTGTMAGVFIKVKKKTCFSVTKNIKHLIDTYLQSEILTMRQSNCIFDKGSSKNF